MVKTHGFPVIFPQQTNPVTLTRQEMACAGQMIWETAMAGVQRCRENLMTDLQLLGDEHDGRRSDEG